MTICLFFIQSVVVSADDDLHDSTAPKNQLWKKESAVVVNTVENTHTPLGESSNSLQQQGMPMPMPDDDEDAFCRGMYMTMFMDGFHFSLGRSKDNPSDCLTYFVSSWRLSEKGKFIGAMFFSFLFALLTEGLSACRGLVVRHCHGKRLRKTLLTLIYALQSTAGYLLMFAAMSYSKELLFSVVAGLMVGNRLFMRYDDFKPKPSPREQTTGRTNPQDTAATAAASREGLLQPLLSNERNTGQTPLESYNTV